MQCVQSIFLSNRIHLRIRSKKGGNHVNTGEILLGQVNSAKSVTDFFKECCLLFVREWRTIKKIGCFYPLVYIVNSRKLYLFFS